MGVEHATLGILVLMSLIVGLVLFYIRKSRGGGKDLYIRRIAGVDAIDEAVGRSAELGRPISFSTGMSGVGPVLWACLGVLHYIARKAARYKSRLILPQRDAEVLPIVEEVTRDAYRAEGRVSNFDPKSLVYLSGEQFAYAAGYMGLIHREQVATAVLLGEFAAESLILAEAGQQVGAMQVAGSITPEQVPFFICTCDYTLIGEEIFGASAYLTREPIQMGSLCGQDRAKLLFLFLILIGVSIATLNSISHVYSPDSEIENVEHWITREFW